MATFAHTWWHDRERFLWLSVVQAQAPVEIVITR